MTTLVENTRLAVPVAHTRPPFDRFDKIVNPVTFALDPFVYMCKLRENYGDIVKMSGLAMDYTFVFSPEYSRQVLSDTKLFYNGEVDDVAPRLPQNSAMRRLIKTMNTINGDKHKQQRRMMMPAFHRKRVDSYRDAMVALTEQKLDEWRPGATYDILREMKQLTLAVAIKTLLGFDPRESETTRKLVERWLLMGSNLAALILPYNFPGSPFKRIVALAEQIEVEFRALIDRKRLQGLDGNDVLTMLMQAHDEDGARFSNEELVAQTLALFVAGHETTATALTWTLFLLAQHPAIMTDLLNELDGKLHGHAPTVEQLNALPLLDAVIKESMRVLSPFLWGFRLATADCEIGNYAIAKGTTVAFAPSVIHHDAQLYPQPKRFLPQRWQTFDPAAYEYMPFTAGPRMCIGATFATMEMKIVLAMMLQRYRLALVPNAKIDRAGFLLTFPKKGMPMQIYNQDRNFSRSTVCGNIQAVVDLG